MIKNKIWTGSNRCEFCDKEFKENIIYGKTRPGCYAALCLKCADIYIKEFFNGSGIILKKNKDGIYEIINWR